VATTKSSTAVVHLVGENVDVSRCAAFHHLTPTQCSKVLMNINLMKWGTDCLNNNRTCGTVYKVNKSGEGKYQIPIMRPLGPFVDIKPTSVLKRKEILESGKRICSSRENSFRGGKTRGKEFCFYPLERLFVAVLEVIAVVSVPCPPSVIWSSSATGAERLKTDV
jgi:hypothetical protein